MCVFVCFTCFLQLIEAVQAVDKIVGQLMNGIKQIGLHRCVNIIILADHGNTQYYMALGHNMREVNITVDCGCRYGGHKLRQKGGPARAGGRHQQLLGQ